MSEQRTHTVDGLLELDQLLERIGRLEHENARRHEEFNVLAEGLRDIQKAFLKECDANIARNDYIWDFLWPLLKREFPQFAGAMFRIHDILKINDSGSPKNN